MLDAAGTGKALRGSNAGKTTWHVVCPGLVMGPVLLGSGPWCPPHGQVPHIRQHVNGDVL